MKTVSIAILDSGIDQSSEVAKKIGIISCLEFYTSGDVVLTSRSGIDDLGHGTAITSLIHKLLPSAQLIPIKIVRDGLISGVETMIAALEYINETRCCEVVNISAGIVSCNDIRGLRACCEKLMYNGIIIISAFDNEGAVSYPAAFPCVIGVDGDRLDSSTVGFFRYDKDLQSFFAPITEQLVPWLNGTKKVVSGNSFIAPIFTAKIAKMLESEHLDFHQIVNRLNEQASGVRTRSHYAEQKIPFSINEVVVFPFNKEMHSLARFAELLDFEVVDFYDVKYSGQVGKKVSLLQAIPESTHTIKNIDKLDWNGNFDTVILGHTSLLSSAVRIDYEDWIIDNCTRYKKKLFSCRDIREKCLSIQNYSPHVVPLELSDSVKMHVIGCPVIGIVGTSSRQGKFTLQLGLRREFQRLGYSVGQLGTEPTSQLFGIDAVYPMGHEHSTYTIGYEAVKAVNHLLGNIEQNYPDIIIVGSQSHTVSIHAGGLADYPVRQHEFLLGCQADVYVLVVSVDSKMSYIKRTISYLEGLFESAVIALVISPISYADRWSIISNKLTKNPYHELEVFQKKLIGKFGLPTYIASDSKIYKDVADICIKYFI